VIGTDLRATKMLQARQRSTSVLLVVMAASADGALDSEYDGSYLNLGFLSSD
jgi:hypothetical protein